jgi:hypothetical protein
MDPLGLRWLTCGATMAEVHSFLLVLELAVTGSRLDASAVDGFRRQPPEVHCFFAWSNFFLHCFESLELKVSIDIEYSRR